MSYLTEVEIPPEISNEIEQQFISRLDNTYYLVYIDYRESLDNSGKTIQQCIDEKSLEPLDELLTDRLSDAEYESTNYHIKEIKEAIFDDNSLVHLHPYIEDWLHDAENKDGIRDKMYDRDKSTPVKDLLDNTNLRARATLYTNYDSLPPNYDLGNTYSYSEYVKDMIDVLYLNPAKVKKAFRQHGINTAGRFPNLAYRNGKEAVTYESFADELLNQCCYGLLTFAGILPLQDLYNNGFQQIKYITIPKGNTCGIFNSWNGGGSIMEMELLRDLKIPVTFKRKTKYDYLALEVDECGCNGYSINEVYGLISSFWGKEFELDFKKEQ